MTTSITLNSWITLNTVKNVAKGFKSRELARAFKAEQTDSKDWKVAHRDDPKIAEFMAEQAAKNVEKAKGKPAVTKRATGESNRHPAADPQTMKAGRHHLQASQKAGESACKMIRSLTLDFPELNRRDVLALAEEFGLNLGTAARQFQETRAGKHPREQ